MAVRAASMNGGTVDQRLAARMAPTSYGSEGTGADGGFAVPPDFRAEIMQKVAGEDSLLGMTDQLTSSSNSISLPKDETTPWQTSGGIQAYWDGEAAQLTQTKPALDQDTIKLHKLTALVPVTEELIEDAPALDTYLRRKAPEKMDFKINLAIVQGTGVGQPIGILASDSLVSVAEDASQAADTVSAMNIFNMYSRMYGPLRKGAVWLINQDVEPQLFSMTIPVKNVAGDDNVGGSVVYLPANGLSSSPYATLMGRPVIPTEACNALGDQGDIILVNLKAYMTAKKTSGLRADTSIHLFFDYAMTAYRFIFRMAGQPWWKSSIARRSGSNTLGWAVALDERAGP
jgi:HK97 family phage major capsid protein